MERLVRPSRPRPRPRLRLGRLLLFVLFCSAPVAPAQLPATGPGGAGAGLRLPAQLTRAHADRLRSLVEACASTPLRVCAVIHGLQAAYGSFADLDGDGRLDYLCTEMIHGQETLASWLDTPDGWRLVNRISRPFGGRHPMAAWVLPDAGQGVPLVLLEVGWAPYVFAIPTDGKGRLLAEQAFGLRRYLPSRRSRQEGVDNTPYRIDGVVSVDRNGTAKVLGFMQDKIGDGADERWIEQRFEIRFRNGRPVGRGRARLPRPVTDAWLHPGFQLPAMRTARRDPHFEPDDASPLRRAVMIRRPMDVDGDGVVDLVAVTCDFAAHVFFGQPGTGTATRPPELIAEQVRPRTIGIRTARSRWALGDKTADNPTFWREQHGVELHAEPGHPGELVMNFYLGSGLIRYTFDRQHRRYVARDVERRIPRTPAHRPGARYRIETHQRSEQIADFDRDGRLDALSLRIASDYRLPADRHHPQAFLSYWQGGQAAVEPHLLLHWPDAVEPVPHWTKGDPISLRAIPVFDAAGQRQPGSDRYCVYFREQRLGVFLARR